MSPLGSAEILNKKQYSTAFKVWQSQPLLSEGPPHPKLTCSSFQLLFRWKHLCALPVTCSNTAHSMPYRMPSHMRCPQRPGSSGSLITVTKHSPCSNAREGCPRGSVTYRALCNHYAHGQCWNRRQLVESSMRHRKVNQNPPGKRWKLSTDSPQNRWHLGNWNLFRAVSFKRKAPSHRVWEGHRQDPHTHTRY